MDFLLNEDWFIIIIASSCHWYLILEENNHSVKRIKQK